MCIGLNCCFFSHFNVDQNLHTSARQQQTTEACHLILSQQQKSEINTLDSIFDLIYIYKLCNAHKMSVKFATRCKIKSNFKEKYNKTLASMQIWQNVTEEKGKGDGRGEVVGRKVE